jgi:hypothetical protein
MGEEIFNRRIISGMGVIGSRIRRILKKAGAGISRPAGCKQALKTLVEHFSRQVWVEIATFIEQARQKLLGEPADILLQNETHFAFDKLLPGLLTDMAALAWIFKRSFHASIHPLTDCLYLHLPFFIWEHKRHGFHFGRCWRVLGTTRFSPAAGLKGLTASGERPV